ncbi:hypothetical protein TNCV_1145621 [Trichonephila clavipes]|nr:hypothetical protein TNCV_1145621 [Trichonephila clavipes]
MNQVVLTEFNGDQMSREMSGGPERKVQKRSEHRVNKRNLSSNDTNSDLPKYRKKSRREETVAHTTCGYNLRPRIEKKKNSPDRPQRGRHNKEGQFDPEKAEKGTIVHTSRSEQDQATRMPDEEVINNGKTRKGEERGQRNPCHWRSWVFDFRLASCIEVDATGGSPELDGEAYILDVEGTLLGVGFTGCDSDIKTAIGDVDVKRSTGAEDVESKRIDGYRFGFGIEEGCSSESRNILVSKRDFVCIAELVSTSRSPDCNLLTDFGSPPIPFRALCMANGDFVDMALFGKARTRLHPGVPPLTMESNKRGSVPVIWKKPGTALTWSTPRI